MLADNWILGARRSASTTSADKRKMGSEPRSLRCRGGRSHLVQKVNCDRIVTYDIWYDITVIVIYLKYIDIFNNLPKKGVSESEGPERYFPSFKIDVKLCRVVISCFLSAVSSILFSFANLLWSELWCPRQTFSCTSCVLNTGGKMFEKYCDYFQNKHTAH